MTTPAASFSMNDLTEAIRDRLLAWDEARFGERLWAKDHTLWSPVEVPELTERLGWLWLPSEMEPLIDVIEEFADEVRPDFDRIVLLGMGGSSLAPEVYQETFGNADGYPDLMVVDSTHPGAVEAAQAEVDRLRTLFVVASKSGGTLETMSLFHYFWRDVANATDDPGRHFVALTDPESKLVQLATDRGFRRVFLTPPDVGGRYSALTLFGLVPAGLIGVDLRAVVASAAAMADACGPGVSAARNPGLVLGAALGEAALAGRDKVTYVVSPSLRSLPGWIEQLVAESTGKDDKGIVPVAGESLGGHDVYGSDRVFVHVMVAGDDPEGQPAALEVLQAAGQPIIRIVLDHLTDLGGEFFRHEVAVAAAGSILGINPFNQPDVQIAKDLAKQAMSEEGLTADITEIRASDGDALSEAWAAWTDTVTQGDYISIHAYLPMSSGPAAVLDEIQANLRDRFRVAVTVGFGPRFLHSTGQLHKGGANNGLFLQIVDEPSSDVPVPEESFTFAELIAGQAAGDFEALTSGERRLLRVNLGSDVDGGLRTLLGLTTV